jgi:signal recognition particle receptor subunit beta
MAVFAAGGEPLVIRVVYDGPPRSGKTTTLAALAGSLARPMISPEEADGRTLFFDWVEYVGGSFEGLPIRCQIVSVPGQRALGRRRRAILATADVVVFVADTTAPGLAETSEALDSLRSQLAARPAPPVGLVLQANKRDRPDALPLGALRDRLRLTGAACVESVAIEGAGIREAFVLAVRLALDRVRELLAAGAVPAEHEAAATTAEELLAQVKAHEAATPPPGAVGAGDFLDGGGTGDVRGAGDVGGTGDIDGSGDAGEAILPPAAAMLREVLSFENAGGLRGPVPAGEAVTAATTAAAVAPATPSHAPAAAQGAAAAPLTPAPAPRLPDSSAPSGRVWPPIEGRVLLHAASGLEAAPRRQADGSWMAEAGSWRLHSLAAHEFHDVEDGKQSLLRWARQHAAGFDRCSPQRCLVLAETGTGTWRLWQVVEVAESLRRRLAQHLVDTDPIAAARALLAAAAGLREARHRFAAEPCLPCRLGAIGRLHARVVYAGLLPPASWIAPPGEYGADDTDLLRREIEPLLRKTLPVSRLDVARTVDALQGEQPQPATAEGRRTRETLASLLIAS